MRAPSRLGAQAGAGAEDGAAPVQADVATALSGYMSTLLSLGIFTPQVVRLWNMKSGDYVAVSTWVLKLFSLTSTALFSLRLGIPVTAWADMLCLTLQVAAVLSLLFAFGSDTQRKTILPALAVYSLWIVAFAFDLIPEEVYNVFQSLAAASLTLALAPQILLNYQERKAGNFSPLTSLLGCLNSSLHTFTTLASSSNPILLATFVGAALSNGVLTGQIVYYNSRKGIGLAEIFRSDLTSGAK